MNSRYTELNNELEDVYAMSEEAACFRYNVDSKAEDDDNQESNDYDRGWCDPAFRTEADFYRMRL